MSNIIQHPSGVKAIDMPPIDSNDHVCANCAFSHFKPNDAVGDCRANPPTALLIVNMQQGLSGRPEMTHSVQSAFPPIERLTFCHTFEPVDYEGLQPPHD